MIMISLKLKTTITPSPKMNDSERPGHLEMQVENNISNINHTKNL